MPRVTKTSFNAELGARIRLARCRCQPAMSQSALGAVLGISFQQVQKYEKGVDRVSAEQLAKIAAAVGRPVAEFYDEVPVAPGSVPTLRAVAQAGGKLDQLSPKVRRRMMALVEALTEGPALAVFEEDAVVTKSAQVAA